MAIPWRQPDFRANPLQALSRRLGWQLHWRFRSTRPITIDHWWKDVRLSLPRSRAAAQLYYRQFSHAPVMRAVTELLRGGDTMLDVGAHVGEYCIVGAHCVGPAGSVHAFEPQAQLLGTIRENAAANRFQNLQVYDYAVSARTGQVMLRTDSRSLGAWLSLDAESGVKTRCISLDDFIEQRGIPRVALLKLDAAGDEIAALQGGRRFFAAQRPSVICKLYNPAVTEERFGYHSRKVLELLLAFEYNVYLLDESSWLTQFPVGGFEELASRFARGDYCLHLLALRGEPLKTS